MYLLSVALGNTVYKIHTTHTLSHNRKLYFHLVNKPWELKSMNSYLPCLKTKLAWHWNSTTWMRVGNFMNSFYTRHLGTQSCWLCSTSSSIQKCPGEEFMLSLLDVWSTKLSRAHQQQRSNFLSYYCHAVFHVILKKSISKYLPLVL